MEAGDNCRWDGDDSGSGGRERGTCILASYRDGNNLILYGSYDHEIDHLMLDNIINLCSKCLSNMHLPDELPSKETAVYF